jgi:hypothetical protein
VKACVLNIVMADSGHDIPLHLYYSVYIKHASEGICKYLYTFLDQFPTVDSNTFTLPWQLIAWKKVVKCYLFSTTDCVCTYTDGTKCRFTQKCSSMDPKKGVEVKNTATKGGIYIHCTVESSMPKRKFQEYYMR